MTNKKGFTLIEIIVVTLIIATLALLVAPSFKNSTLTTNMEKAKIGLAELNTALKLYYEIHPNASLKGILAGKKFETLADEDTEYGYSYLQHPARWKTNPSGNGMSLNGMNCEYYMGDKNEEDFTYVYCKFKDDEDNEQCNAFFIRKSNPAVIKKGEVPANVCSTL